MDDLISRQEAIEAINEAYCTEYEDGYNDGIDFAISTLSALPSTQPKTSRIENALHGKSAEEQCDFLYWLMQDYGRQFIDTRVAVIEWLRGENDG